MVSFEEFPGGNEFWLVKAVDRFRLPHAMSESASVGVLLQEMEAALGKRAADLRPDQISKLFALPTGGQRPAFRVARIHAGSLPAVRVGQVYQQQTYRAELPTQMGVLNLINAERSTRAARLDEQLAPPTGWDARMPYRLLLSGEYFVEPDWRAQRVVSTTASDGREVVIPRMTIFQRFYGPHSEMADAFTSGPWEMVRQRMVCDTPLENGLQTRDAVELNEWHLVLQTLIPDEFRWHVALFCFDEYAQQQARALYSEAVAQRHGRKDSEWFCNATFPFNPDHPLRIKVKGYELSATRNRPKPAFLVTSILSATAPPYLPGLAWGRLNSGDVGATVTEVGGPRPYTSKGSRPPPSQSTPRVGAEHAPPTNAAVSGFVTDTFEWMGALKERKLEKASSKRYTDDRGGASPQPGPGPDSTSKPVSGGQAGSSLRMTSQVRPAVAQFENLLHCLGALKKSRSIDNFQIVQPGEPSQRAERGGRIVWNLIEKQVLSDGARPKRPWRMIPGRADADDIPTGRTVLVVEVKIKGDCFFLFEVEPRPTESGFLLAALSVPEGAYAGRQAICNAMLGEIITSEGKHLDDAAKRVANSYPQMQGGGTKHQYVVEKGIIRLDPNVVLRLFRFCRGETPSIPSSASTAMPSENDATD